jgi:hypothetical protein
MNIVYKILLFSIFSISLPIGKLFEIFIWNDRIIKTEIVSEKQRLESRGRICYFVKPAKEIQKKLSIFLQNRPFYTNSKNYKQHKYPILNYSKSKG